MKLFMCVHVVFISFKKYVKIINVHILKTLGSIDMDKETWNHSLQILSIGMVVPSSPKVSMIR